MFIFEFLSIVRDEWFGEADTICLFREMKAVSNLNFKLFNVPNPDKQTAALSRAMIYATSIEKVVRDVYEGPVIDEIDLEDLKRFATEFSYERCNIVLARSDPTIAEEC